MIPTPTPEQMELLRQARRANLMKIWTTGSRRLSSEEQSEIADVIGFAEEADDALPLGDPPSFALEPNAPLPAKLRGYYKKVLADYQPDFNRGERAVKRWVSAGRKAKPRPDLPPLDEPHRMAAWWRRLFPSEPVPLELLDYEAKAPTPSPASSEAPPPSGEPVATGAAPAPSAPIFLDRADLGSTEAVRRSAAVEDAYFQLMEKALAEGNRDEAKKWRNEYAEQAELTNRLRRQAREEAKAAGEVLPKGRMIAELAQMLEALRLAHGAMGPKIMADLEKRLSGRLRRILKLLGPQLLASIETIRSREADLLSNIEGLRSPVSAREAFTLAA